MSVNLQSISHPNVPSMNKLPHDLVFLIAKELKLLHLNDRSWPSSTSLGLAQYAVINRTWNVVIESMTFQSLSVYSSDIPKDIRKGPITTARLRRMMMRDPRRRCAIPHEIFFHASYKYDLTTRYAHSEMGRKENDEHFSRSILIFWKMLSNLEAIRPNDPLEIHLYCDSVDSLSPPDGQSPIDLMSPPHLKLVGAPLPQLRSVSSFHTDDDVNLLWPSALLDISASLQRLEHATIGLCHLFDEKSEISVKYFQELGKTFSQIPSTCLSVNVTWDDSSNDFRGPVDAMFLVPDHVGIGLRNLSTRLRSIKLINIRISPSLFWPGADEQQHEKQSQTDEENGDHDPSLLPSWPNLETFEVSAELPDTVAASRPVESINEIIAAVGHAARRMPKLKFMEVDVDAPHHDMWAILKVRSAAAGETNCEFTWDSGRALPVSWSKETVKAWGLEGEGVLRVQRDGSEWSAVANLPWLGSSSETL